LRTHLAKNPEQVIAAWAESWRDREAGMSLDTAPLPAPPQNKQNGAAANRRIPAYRAGQRVRHERFGEGVITKVTAENNETTLAILFDAAQERSFLAALVQDKLSLVG
jgi:hypothetical protein